MQVLFHDVIESDEQYIFIGETYYPTFHTETRTTYSNGQWTTTTVTIFDGYVYNECVAFATDKKGNYQWSSLFKLPYYRTFYPTRELVKINPIGDKLAVTNFNKGFLVTYFLDEEGFTQKDDDTKVNLTKKDDKLNSRSSNLEIWYDNYYLAYGEISLRAKKKGDNGKKNRQFIYLYKMEIGSEYKDEKSED